MQERLVGVSLLAIEVDQTTLQRLINRIASKLTPTGLIVPTLCVGIHFWTLCVFAGADAERHGLRSHADHGNDHWHPEGVNAHP